MIRVILVDDEENALDILGVLLREIGNVEIVGRYMNPLQAVEDIRQQQIDAVFLDIDMPGMNGMELAQVIQTIDSRTQIVFTTAHANFAVDAFALNSLDYLLKPFTLERLRNSVKRIEANVSKLAPEAELHPKICCMGNFRLLADGTERGRLRWRTRKEKELCAFLIHHHGQAVDHSVIMEALWPEADRTSKAYLYTCVSLLRKKFMESGMPATVNKIDNGYELDLDGVECDVLELEQLLDQTISGEGLSERRYAKIDRLYKGEYLGDCDYVWAEGKRHELSRKYVLALRKLSAFFKQKGCPVKAVDCLRRILAVMPDSEQDGRELIKLYIETGNRSDAIKAYRQLEYAVREQLSAELEEETLQLYKQFHMDRS